jgi:DNA-binding MarR family transcriptional regulator
MAIQDLYATPGYLIRRCRQVAVAIFAREAAPFGITSQQYTTLRALAEFGQLEQTQLCDTTALDRSTIATLLVRLEEKNLVRRAPAPHDRRKNHVELTATGEQLVHEMEPTLARIQERILAPLAPEERAPFTRMLARIVEYYDVEDGASRAVAHGSAQ